MASRPAKLSEGGGGKFNGVDGVITGYEFTTTHPFSKGGRSKSDFSPLYGVLSARMDSAKEDDIDVMLVGSADDFEIFELACAVADAFVGAKDAKDAGFNLDEVEKLHVLVERLEAATRPRQMRKVRP